MDAHRRQIGGTGEVNEFFFIGGPADGQFVQVRPEHARRVPSSVVWEVDDVSGDRRKVVYDSRTYAWRTASGFRIEVDVYVNGPIPKPDDVKRRVETKLWLDMWRDGMHKAQVLAEDRKGPR